MTEFPERSLTVAELVTRMRAELTNGSPAREQDWSAVQTSLAHAQQNAEIDSEPPLRPWQGALRPLARGAARAVLFLARFITHAQIRFNVNMVNAMTALLAGTRRLESAHITQTEQTNARLRDLEHVLSRLQGELVDSHRHSAHANTVDATDNVDDVAHLDDLYVALEDRFRGGREEIKERLRTYLPLLAAAAIRTDEDLLDVGCGRGEWLDLMRENGWRCQGIDGNRAMIARCRALGLDVIHADGIAFLRQRPPASAALLSAFHVAEHLTFAALAALFGEAARVLRRDGLLLIETPNPEDERTATRDFFLDPTHRHPLPPALLVFLAEATGFDRITVLSPHAEHAGSDYALIARRA